jgi:hypothetical protein
MAHSLLADAVVLVHLGFILFVMFGGLLVLRSRRVAYLHVPAAAWGAYVELAGKICPLTPLELSLRAKAGQSGYESSFIDHYIVPIVYPIGLTPAMQSAAGALVIAVNAVVYGSMLLRRKRNVGSV